MAPCNHANSTILGIMFGQNLDCEWSLFFSQPPLLDLQSQKTHLYFSFNLVCVLLPTRATIF